MQRQRPCQGGGSHHYKEGQVCCRACQVHLTGQPDKASQCAQYLPAFVGTRFLMTAIHTVDICQRCNARASDCVRMHNRGALPITCGTAFSGLENATVILKFQMTIKLVWTKALLKPCECRIDAAHMYLCLRMSQLFSCQSSQDYGLPA